MGKLSTRSWYWLRAGGRDRSYYAGPSGGFWRGEKGSIRWAWPHARNDDGRPMLVESLLVAYGSGLRKMLSPRFGKRYKRGSRCGVGRKSTLHDCKRSCSSPFSIRCTAKLAQLHPTLVEGHENWACCAIFGAPPPRVVTGAAWGPAADHEVIRLDAAQTSPQSGHELQWGVLSCQRNGVEVLPTGGKAHKTISTW